MRINSRYLIAAPALAFVLTLVPACGDDSGSNSPGSTLPAITDSTPVEPSSEATTSSVDSSASSSVDSSTSSSADNASTTGS